MTAYTLTITFHNREIKTLTTCNKPTALALYAYYKPGRLLHRDAVVLTSELTHKPI